MESSPPAPSTQDKPSGSDKMGIIQKYSRTNPPEAIKMGITQKYSGTDPQEPTKTGE